MNTGTRGGWLRRGAVPAVLTAVSVLASVCAALAAPGPSTPTVVLLQSGHWMVESALDMAVHVHGGTRQVDARVALPDEVAQNALMALEGETDGFIVGRDRAWTFDKSTLSITTSVPLPVADETPVGIEVPGGPYLVYRARGTVVRLGRPTAVVEAGGPLGPPVRTSDGTVWVHRPDSGALCAFRRNAVDLDCDLRVPGAPPGGLTVTADVATFVDSRDDTARLVRDEGLAAASLLGVDLPDDALLADQTTRARLPVVVPTAGQLRMVDSTGAAGPPLDVALGTGTFSAPFVSGEIVAVLELGTSTLTTFDADGTRISELRLPPGTDATAVRRGEDGRLYVDEDGGGRAHVLRADGTVATLDLGRVGTGWDAVAGAAPESQSAPVAPPPPGRVTVPSPDVSALPDVQGESALGGAPGESAPIGQLPVGGGRGDGGRSNEDNNSAGPGDRQPVPEPPVPAPAPPTGVTAELSGTDQATITWQPGSGGGAATSYAVTSSGGDTIPTTATRATFPNLAPGAYTFTVTASNTAGTSAASASSNRVDVPPEKPPISTGLTAKRTDIDGSMEIIVSWSTPSAAGWEVTGYEVTGTSEYGVSLYNSTTNKTSISDSDSYCWPNPTYEVITVARPTAQSGGAPKKSDPATVLLSAPVDCTADVSLTSATANADGSITVEAQCLTDGHGPAKNSTIAVEFNGDLKGFARCDSSGGGGSVYRHTWVVNDLTPDTEYRINAVIASASGEKRSSTVTVTTAPEN